MDHLSNLITSLRNAEMVRHSSLTVPNSKLSRAFLEVLKGKGYVSSFMDQDRDIVVSLPMPVQLHHYKRVSKPGRRFYANRHEVKSVLRGLGISVLSTSQGLMTDDEARRRKLGGEVLCEVY